MNLYINTAIRALFTFVALCVIQYQIPWYLLTIGAVGAGFFMYKTSDDRALSLGILIGGAAFGVFAFVTAQYFPVSG